MDGEVRRDRNDDATGRRILFIQTATTPILGADAWVLLRIIEHLDTSRNEVEVACRRSAEGRLTPVWSEVSDLDDVQLIDCDLGPELSGRTGMARLMAMAGTLRAVEWLVRLAVRIRRRRIAIVHAGDRPRDALAAVLLGRCTGAVSVVHVHQVYSEWWTRLLRWAIHRADVVVPVSEFVAASLRAGGVRPERIRPVLNAIDPERWSGGVRAPSIRDELGLDDETPIVLAACRLFPEKGVGELVEAFAGVRRRVDGAQLLVAGNDLSPGGWYSAELESLAAELGIADAVTLLGRRSDVRELMAAADVFALPSRGEPFGLVYLEAMAMELPVVALADGGALEIIEHDDTGLLCEPFDVSELENCIVTLLEDAELRAQMGRRGRARVAAHFTLELQAEVVDRLYDAALAAGGRRGR